MTTIADLFGQMAQSATTNDFVTFEQVADRLFTYIEQNPQFLENADDDLLDGYAHIIDYSSSHDFTSNRDDAIMLLDTLSKRSDFIKKTCG